MPSYYASYRAWVYPPDSASYGVEICTMVLSNEIDDGVHEKHRMFTHGAELMRDGSFRSIVESSRVMPSIGEEKSVVHDKISCPKRAYIPASPDPRYTFVRMPYCYKHQQASFDDQFAGTWFVPVGKGYLQFSVSKYNGKWNVGGPSGYTDFMWQQDYEGSPWYSLYLKSTSIPGNFEFPSAKEAYLFGMQLIGDYSVYESDWTYNANVNFETGRIWERGIIAGRLRIFDISDKILDFALLDGKKTDHVPPLGLDSVLAENAISAMNFNTNNIANIMAIRDLIAGLAHPGQLLDDLASKAKSGIFENSKNAWLQYRYVYSTTLSDIEEGMRYCTKADTNTCRAGQVVDTGEMHMKIVLKSDIPSEATQFDTLSKLGLAPDLYNIWDMVPYSFVCDWFVDIGGFLERITNRGKALRYDVVSVTTSWKWKEVVDYKIDDDLTIPITMEHYDRMVTSKLPSYIPYVETPTSGKTIIKRCLDSVALFVG